MPKEQVVARAKTARLGTTVRHPVKKPFVLSTSMEFFIPDTP
jgi:hypothetical protein